MVVNILMNVPSTVTIKVFFRHVKNSVFVRIYFTVSSCGLLGQKYISPAVTFDPLLMAFEKILRHGTIQIKPNMVITIYATTVNTFSDLDFTNRDTSTPIVMEAIVLDVPEELLKLEKYGQYIQLLKGDDVVSDLEDPDADQEKKVLKVRLTVDDTLEPKWTIISDREIGNISFAHGDRAKLNMFMVSDYIDNHFSYSIIAHWL